MTNKIKQFPLKFYLPGFNVRNSLYLWEDKWKNFKLKFLAVEKEIKLIPSELREEILKSEAKKVLEISRQGILSEIYFNEENCAILILNCRDRQEAIRLLDSLPLCIQGYISFELHQLNPYTGFSRLDNK